MNHNFEELAEIAVLELCRGKTRTSSANIVEIVKVQCE